MLPSQALMTVSYIQSEEREVVVEVKIRSGRSVQERSDETEIEENK